MHSDALASAAWLRLSGSTRLFPVIGHPAAQVRAPAVFNDLFARAGIDAVSFGLDLPPDQVATTCRGLLASPNVGGLLVTVPYKRILCGLPELLGKDASIAGSLNALRRGTDGRVEGDLFDGTGFLHGLLAAGHSIAGRRILLLGAGGAGAAIAAKLGEAAAAEVMLYDLDRAAANALAASVGRHYPKTTFRAQDRAGAAGCDIVINATPAGLRADDALPLDPAQLAPGTLVCDIVMKPATTRLLERALARGLPVHRGRAMLDHQVPAYLDFFGLPELARRVHVGAETIELR